MCAREARMHARHLEAVRWHGMVNDRGSSMRNTTLRQLRDIVRNLKLAQQRYSMVHDNACKLFDENYTPERFKVDGIYVRHGGKRILM